jgi:tetratricopeptide (TPR) repeat protein
MLILLLLSFVLAGCGPTKDQKRADRALSAYMAGDYEAARERLRPAAKKPDENFVLNNVRLGSCSLIDYHLDEAEDAFLRAYEVINSVGVNDGGRSLGAALVDEKIKIWKGEPFERAMANFYLGLIYYMRQDYNNARGAFENALFKLRDYADKNDVKNDYREQESNFVIALVMLGKTWQKLGRDDLAHANFDRARDLRPDLAGLCDFERNARSNLLLVVEFGAGPQKIADADGSVVGFAPSPREAGAIPGPQVVIDRRSIDVAELSRPPIDLLEMAQDRRWQDIDTIRTIKDVAGTGLIVGGAAAGIYGADRRRDDVALAGLAAMGAGMLLKASSQADVRYWEMLPRTVFILPLHVEPGTHDLTVAFPHTGGLRQSWQDIVVPNTGEATYYIRMQRYGPVERVWPPPGLAEDLTANN